MTSAKMTTLKFSVICAMGLGASAFVPTAMAALAGPYRAEATLATAAQSATDKDVDGVAWSRGREMSSTDLENCNRAAAQ